MKSRKYIKIVGLILFGVLFYINLSSVDLAKKIVPSQTLTYKEGLHVPLIFILDNYGVERTDTKSFANTYTLAHAFHVGNAAILVSQSVLYNFFYRRKYSNTELITDALEKVEHRLIQLVRCTKESWKLYRIVNSQYFTNNNQLYLFIPQRGSNIFNDVFKVETMENLTSFLVDANSNEYMSLLNKLKYPFFKPPFLDPSLMTQDLKKVFKNVPERFYLDLQRPKNWDVARPILDIFLHGHGSPKPRSIIASLTPAEIEKLIAFFNNELRIGVLIVNSCYSGGENLNNFKFKKEKAHCAAPKEECTIFYKLNFILIAQSVGDMFVSLSTFSSDKCKKFFFESIFKAIQNLGKTKHDSLGHLLKKMHDFNQCGYNSYRQGNIPQIILPGGLEIQTLTPDKQVEILGKVKVKKAELERKPLLIYPKKESPTSLGDLPLNVLIYPSIIEVPLLLRPSLLLGKAINSNTPEYITHKHETFPTYRDLILKNVSDPARIENFSTLRDNHYLYPNIISMIHGNASHYFEKLMFEGSASKLTGGILMGIRDSFLSLETQSTAKNFYIDSIEGSNDISIVLNALRLFRENRELFPLEKELVGVEPVLLRHVTIITQGSGEGIKLVIIKFQIDDKAWAFRYDRPLSPAAYYNHWHFIRINAGAYESEYQKAKREIFNQQNREGLSQTSLVEILREKRAKSTLALSVNNLQKLASTLNSLCLALT